MDTKRSKRSGRLLHTRRHVVPARPIHITTHACDDVPDLRRPEIRAHLGELLAHARRCGVRTVALTVMGSHLHWMAIADSAAALRDATRVVFGKLARFVNRLFGRRGKVFVERYASTCAETTRHACHMLNYVLANPATAGYRLPADARDPFTEVFEEVLTGDRFLRSVVGPPGPVRGELLARMARGRVPWVPIGERCQPRLPGL